MQNHEIFHLIEVLKRYRLILGGWPRVTEDIYEANRQYGRAKIDRRTLTNLCKEDKNIDNIQLSVEHLLSLDQWLVSNNEPGLLARHRNLLDSVRESYAVNFLVAAKRFNEMNTDVVSRADLGAITRLLRTPLNRLSIDIRTVKGPGSSWLNNLRNLKAATISIASPVANHASQIIMSRMLGLGDEHVDFEELPFYIVGADRDKPAGRYFVRTRKEMENRGNASMLPKKPGKRALVVNRKWYVSDDKSDYALLLAQRDRDTGHAQVVLCGLFGDSTYRLARILQSGQPRDILPPLQYRQKHPPILVAVYKMAQLKKDNEGISKYSPINDSVVDQPVQIHYRNNQWRFPEEKSC